MTKKKTLIDAVEEMADNLLEQMVLEKKIVPITETFSNGDMNILRDKINEIIAKI